LIIFHIISFLTKLFLSINNIAAAKISPTTTIFAASATETLLFGLKFPSGYPLMIPKLFATQRSFANQSEVLTSLNPLVLS